MVNPSEKWTVLRVNSKDGIPYSLEESETAQVYESEREAIQDARKMAEDNVKYTYAVLKITHIVGRPIPPVVVMRCIR